MGMTIQDMIDKRTWLDKLKSRIKIWLELPHDIWWRLRNIWNLSHCLKSDVPFGQYCDKPYLIESALFETLSDYVSKDGEDAFRYHHLDDEEDMHCEWYEKMVKVLHFYHVELPELNKKMESYYGKRTGTMVFNDIEGDTTGCKEIEFVYESEQAKKESYEALEEQLKLEEIIHEKTTENLKMIIEFRGYMWS